VRLPSAGSKARPRELEDSLNYFIYHPLAHRLAVALLPSGVSPNAVSVAGALLIMGAAWAYVGLAWPTSVLIGFTLHALWHVVDGADGDLARLSGKASSFGEAVDGACDYVGHVVLYVALAAFMDDQYGGWAWVLASLAGASHIAQTNHAESQRRIYLWRAYGRPWMKNSEEAGEGIFHAKGWLARLLGACAREYLRVSKALTPGASAVDAAIEAAQGDPRRLRRIRTLSRRLSGTAILLEKALGANPRTIILGISMAFGTPLWFFLAECVALNLLLLFSIRYHERSSMRLAETVARA